MHFKLDPLQEVTSNMQRFLLGWHVSGGCFTYCLLQVCFREPYYWFWGMFEFFFNHHLVFKWDYF